MLYLLPMGPVKGQRSLFAGSGSGGWLRYTHDVFSSCLMAGLRGVTAPPEHFYNSFIIPDFNLKVKKT
jgi:hypothetical protein